MMFHLFLSCVCGNTQCERVNADTELDQETRMHQRSDSTRLTVMGAAHGCFFNRCRKLMTTLAMQRAKAMTRWCILGEKG